MLRAKDNDVFCTLKDLINFDNCNDLEFNVVQCKSARNKIENFGIVKKKVRCYHDPVGPTDALKMVIDKSSMSYKVLAYHHTVKEGPFAR